MISNVLKACGVIVLGLSASLMFREKSRLMSFAAVVCSFFPVTLFFLKNGLSDSVETVLSAAQSYFPDTAKIMLKALGIAYITSITCEICNSAGENTLSNAAAFAGKTEIIILCIPLLSQLLKIAGDTL